MLLAGLFFVAACLGVLIGNILSPLLPLLFGPLAPLACIVYPPAMVVTNVLMIPFVGAVTFVGGLGDLAVVGLGLGGLAALLGGLGLGGLAALLGGLGLGGLGLGGLGLGGLGALNSK